MKLVVLVLQAFAHSELYFSSFSASLIKIGGLTKKNSDDPMSMQCIFYELIFCYTCLAFRGHGEGTFEP